MIITRNITTNLINADFNTFCVADFNTIVFLLSLAKFFTAFTQTTIFLISLLKFYLMLKNR